MYGSEASQDALLFPFEAASSSQRETAWIGKVRVDTGKDVNGLSRHPLRTFRRRLARDLPYKL
jgi:hypothetical protein